MLSCAKLVVLKVGGRVPLVLLDEHEDGGGLMWDSRN